MRKVSLSPVSTTETVNDEAIAETMNYEAIAAHPVLELTLYGFRITIMNGKNRKEEMSNPTLRAIYIDADSANTIGPILSGTNAQVKFKKRCQDLKNWVLAEERKWKDGPELEAEGKS